MSQDVAIIERGAVGQRLDERLMPGRLETHGLVLDFDGYVSAVGVLQAMQAHSGFWLGDLLVWAEERYGEDYAQAIGADEHEVERATRAYWICKRWPPNRRRIGGHVKFAHYECVTARWITDEMAEQWLSECEANRWSQRVLREVVQSWKGRNRVPQATPQAMPPEPPEITDPETVHEALVMGPASTNGASPLAVMQSAPTPPVVLSAEPPSVQVLPPEQTSWPPGMAVEARVPPHVFQHKPGRIIAHHYESGMPIVDFGYTEVYVLRNWADMRRPERGE